MKDANLKETSISWAVITFCCSFSGSKRVGNCLFSKGNWFIKDIVKLDFSGDFPVISVTEDGLHFSEPAILSEQLWLFCLKNIPFYKRWRIKFKYPEEQDVKSYL